MVVTNSEITDDFKYLNIHCIVSTRGVQTVDFSECDVPRLIIFSFLFFYCSIIYKPKDM